MESVHKFADVDVDTISTSFRLVNMYFVISPPDLAEKKLIGQYQHLATTLALLSLLGLA